MNDNAVVRITGVDFAYGTELVLEKVNLTISAKEFVYVVGPNGGGKTTLLKLILGLLKPTAGTIEVWGMSPEKARPRVGYTPQHIIFDPQFPVTVKDIVLMGRLNGKNRSFYNAGDREAAYHAMEQMEIQDLARKRFSQLSGGQKQRALIARSLVSKPEILLLDEPTANVDMHTEDRLMSIINDLNREHTILLVSHDLNFVAEKVKQVVCVDRRVHIHPTSDVTGEAVRNIYEKNMRIIRHDIKPVNRY